MGKTASPFNFLATGERQEENVRCGEAGPTSGVSRLMESEVFLPSLSGVAALAEVHESGSGAESADQ